jgi:thiol-disulfide isomerase/thioredoxin
MSAIIPATIEYIGATWCAPCRTVKPLATVLAHRYSVPITFLDYDEMEDADKDQVKKLPTLRIHSESGTTEITTNHADTLELWLRKNVRVNGEEDF